MAQREVKYGYASARYAASDGVTVATQTLADTSIIPSGAIITSTTVIARGVVASGGSATISIIAGGVTTTSAIAKAKLDTADFVVREDVVEDAAAVSDGTAIKVAVGTAALTGGTALLDIIVEYILID
tara:strand:+ start:12976 stop:13359 length:384 start_codon:yes stop_codon:yes gene_type:complete